MNLNFCITRIDSIAVKLANDQITQISKRGMHGKELYKGFSDWRLNKKGKAGLLGKTKQQPSSHFTLGVRVTSLKERMRWKSSGAG